MERRIQWEPVKDVIARGAVPVSWSVKSEYLPMEDGEQRVSPCDPCEEELWEKEQKDAELDKKIKALKKKNEALMQRHREIEEDRLRAEKDGMAVTSRRLKQDSLTITITKTPNVKRIVRKGRRSSDSTEQKFTLLMGNEMQLSVSMDSKVEGKAMNSKKTEPDVLFLTSKTSKDVLTIGRGPHMQIAISRQKPGDKCELGGSDYPPTISAVEQSEYLEWKKEREKVDHERLARQKNSKGEWRRTWDKGKKDEASESDMCYIDTVPIAFCSRRGDWGRRMQCRENETEKKGAGRQNCNEKTLRMMNTMSSRAKGKDRLTGRAQRWYSIEHEDASYLPEDFVVQKSLEDKVTDKHPEGNFKEDEFLNKEKLNVPVQNNSLGNEEKIVFANEKMLPESKQDVPFHGKKMEVRSNDVLSEGREMIEYLSVLSCDGEPSQNSAELQHEQRSS
ncbi:coiled-coil domain-containing protein 9B isoform X2 [Hyla sarda]|uniref:coiled-coil domain-containing protein 9B isoform X2 n=1 Tax=Hyla sarda TaxID=327740 RepID=UPI0024C2C701|nr:coiled-coil domain-containing protein 9B isoform X2 [Hyla sarda]